MDITQTGAPRSFAVFVQQIGDGDLNAEASEEFHKLALAVQAEALARQDAASGSLTIKIKVKGDPRNVAHFTWDVKADPPKKKRCGASAWVNKQGHVVFENPRQPSLFPREVKIEDAVIREVEAPAQMAVKEI